MIYSYRKKRPARRYYYCFIVSAIIIIIIISIINLYSLPLLLLLLFVIRIVIIRKKGRWVQATAPRWVDFHFFHLQLSATDVPSPYQGFPCIKEHPCKHDFSYKGFPFPLYEGFPFYTGFPCISEAPREHCAGPSPRLASIRWYIYDKLWYDMLYHIYIYIYIYIDTCMFIFL